MSNQCDTTSWNERMIRRMAGIFILISVVLAWTVDMRWLGFTAFVGLNLFQFSFTNFCPMSMILSKFDPTQKAAPNNG